MIHINVTCLMKKTSYYIVQYPIIRVAQSALDCSIRHHLNFSGKHTKW